MSKNFLVEACFKYGLGYGAEHRCGQRSSRDMGENGLSVCDIKLDKQANDLWPQMEAIWFQDQLFLF